MKKASPSEFILLMISLAEECGLEPYELAQACAMSLHVMSPSAKETTSLLKIAKAMVGPRTGPAYKEWSTPWAFYS